MKKFKKNQAGFTLIELAIIIAVLGILGAVGAVKFADMTKEAEAAAQKTALANARSALAIAIAMDKDGVVTVEELGQYLDGSIVTAGNATFTLDGRDMHVDDPANVTSVATGSASI